MCWDYLTCGTAVEFDDEAACKACNQLDVLGAERVQLVLHCTANGAVCSACIDADAGLRWARPFHLNTVNCSLEYALSPVP